MARRVFSTFDGRPARPAVSNFGLEGDLRLRANRPDRDSKAEQLPSSVEAEAAGFNLEANRLHNERVSRLRTAMFDAIEGGADPVQARDWFFKLRQTPTLICPWVLTHHIPAECWRCDMVAAGRAKS